MTRSFNSSWVRTVALCAALLLAPHAAFAQAHGGPGAGHTNSGNTDQNPAPHPQAGQDTPDNGAQRANTDRSAADTSTTTEAAAIDGLGAVGPCVWAPAQAPEAGETLLGGFAVDAASQIVKSFAALLAEQAGPSTSLIQAYGIFNSDDQCVFIARGHLAPRSVDEVANDLRTWNYGPPSGPNAAQTLHDLGLTFSERPDLFIEARLWRVGKADGKTLFRLEPSFIAFEHPVVNQWLRFWSPQRRNFALQVQFTPAPGADNAVGGQANLGEFAPGERHNFGLGALRDGVPNASTSFGVDRSVLHNVRISVIETSSRSVLLSVLSGAAGGEHVQAQAAQGLSYIIDPSLQRAANQASNDASLSTWRTTHDALVGLVNACPVNETDADKAGQWTREHSAQIELAVRDYNRAASAVGRSAAPDYPREDARSTQAILAWCRTALTALH